MMKRARLGSARVSRAGFGVTPKQSFLQELLVCRQCEVTRRKFAIAETRSPMRETRALPR